jgi:N-carbamoyl-L-amino-acid hydrolase
MSNSLEIDGDRLWSTLNRSAEIGRFREVGLRRLALSPEDKEVRDQFVAWAREAGCQISVDEIGNIFARRAGTDDSLPPVVTGSHLDTQINGGRYDGILGVLSGLEIIRRLNDLDLTTKRPIEVVVWTNEEGARFIPPMMGSLGFTGAMDKETILATLDKDGVTVGDALKQTGYDGGAPLGNRPFDAYFELHIEQGPVLDANKCPVGIVVSGMKSYGRRLEIHGETAHVGPTEMTDRHNALAAAGRIIAAVDDIGWEHHLEGGKSTTTMILCEPNLAGIVPEYAKLGIDFRHPVAEKGRDMQAAVDRAIAAAAKKNQVRIETVDAWEFGASPFADECIDLISATARDLRIPYREMMSEAGHDAYAIGEIAPMGMIFTPCKSGISHNTKEEISLHETIPGCNLLLNTMLRRADR